MRTRQLSGRVQRVENLGVRPAELHHHGGAGIGHPPRDLLGREGARNDRQHLVALDQRRARGGRGCAEARYAVSMIVGRDTSELTETGVTKAAVETVAENASDGVIAPMLYMAVGGVPLMFLYKGINTMDSMLGYKMTNIFISAVLRQSWMMYNYIPARISGWLMVAGTVFTGMDVKNAAKIYKRDRRNHASPNSAQTEAAMAGALDVQLAGNAYYFGKLYEKPTIGDWIRPGGAGGYQKS